MHNTDHLTNQSLPFLVSFVGIFVPRCERVGPEAEGDLAGRQLCDPGAAEAGRLGPHRLLPPLQEGGAPEPGGRLRVQGLRLPDGDDCASSSVWLHHRYFFLSCFNLMYGFNLELGPFCYLYLFICVDCGDFLCGNFCLNYYLYWHCNQKSAQDISFFEAWWGGGGGRRT